MFINELRFQEKRMHVINELYELNEFELIQLFV